MKMTPNPLFKAIFSAWITSWPVTLLHLRADQTSSKFQAPEIAWLEVFLPPSALYGV